MATVIIDGKEYEYTVLDGTVTKDLVALNPWLFDDDCIKFNYPTEVLIAVGVKIDTHTNHTINGENTNDFIKEVA